MNLIGEAKEYLDYYLDRKVETDYAVLIKGKWGSGKSHFVTSYLDARDAARKKEDPLNGRGYLRASWYGVSSVAEIGEQFFAQAHPALNSAPARMLTGFLARAVNLKLGGEVVKSGDEAKVKDAITKAADYVLVFDDLERCAMPIVEALGFINRFVEQDRCKVIILCAENEVPKAQQQAYRARREKIVGKTLQVGSDPGEVYDHLASRLRTPAATAAVVAHREAAIATFAASKHMNFRSMRAVLADFDRLVGAVDKRLGETPKATEQLLTYMMAVGMEVRAGALKPAEIQNLADARRGVSNEFLIPGAAPTAKSERMKVLRELTLKYPDVAWRDPVAPAKALGDLLSSGVLARDDINDHIGRHPVVVGYVLAPAWRRLWSWQDLSEDEYATAARDLRQDLSDQNLTAFAEIMHAFGIMLYLQKLGAEVLRTKSLSTYLNRYLGKLERVGKLEYDPRFTKGALDMSAFGLGYMGEETAEWPEVTRLIQEANARTLARRLGQDAPAVLLKLGGHRGEKLLYEYGHGADAYGAVPILNFIRPGDLAELIFAGGRLNGSLLSALGSRYDMFGHHLREEWPRVAEIQGAVDARIRKLKLPHRARAEVLAGNVFRAIETRIAQLKAFGD